MNSRKPPPRKRSEPGPVIPAHALGAHAVPEDGAQGGDGNAAMDGEADAIPAAAPAWRGALAALTERGALTHAQEAACERLIRTHEDEIRAELPPLLHALKPHFDTPGEAEAKQAFVDALQALKDRQQQDFVRLLDTFGLDASVLSTPA